MKLKTFLISTLTVLVCFGGGFYYGSYPDQFNKFFNLRSTKIKILIEDEALLPKELRIWFFERTGYKIEISKAQNFEDFLSKMTDHDLIFTSQSWAKEVIPSLLPFENMNLSKTISSDFLSLQITKDMLIPLLWKKLPRVEGYDNIRIYVLGKTKSDISKKVIEEFLNIQTHKLWLKTSNFSSCAKDVDFLNEFQQEQKPSFFRTLNLTNLQIL